jgi:Peptidase family M48
MPSHTEIFRAKRWISLFAAFLVLQGTTPRATHSNPPPKLKIRGYVTARTDSETVAILSDQIRLPVNGKISKHDASGDHSISGADLQPGMLIEAEGVWTEHHRFSAEKVEVEAGVLDKQIHNSSYLQEEPKQAARIQVGESAELAADGEWLLLSSRTKREWSAPSAAVVEASTSASVDSVSTPPPAGHTLAGYRVTYTGIRQPDGRIAADKIELGSPAPPDAYKMPHGMEVVRGKDPQTGIDVLEFRRGKKVDGRLKLFADSKTQEYVRDLGDSLLPPGAKGTSKALEFRFFVIEDSSINAFALPDGTVIVDTGLLGAVENEAQLAFVLSHEIAHVLQAHYWREVHETRAQRVTLLIAGIAASGFIGNIGLFLAELGMASIVNGHQRELENQADRLGLQNIIQRGYDPRSAPGFMNIIIEHYGSRSASKLWSNHESNVLRGSFLTVQLMQQYPAGHFDGARVDTPAFQAMRESMGPVKID